ncbi:MAG: AAA family ATPase [Oligoflexales bacterium]
MSHASEYGFTACADLADKLRQQINTQIFGQKHLVDEALCCFLVEGHILITGAPGLAKTTLVRIFSQSLGLQFGRVQFTPDLLPSDIIGTDILNLDAVSGKRSFDFSKGPVFTNLMLADEINRASPRTQSALLEAMQEKNCTVNGITHKLPQPFMVFATQNPFESEGTFPLPEAQLDRFMLHSLVDYPDAAAEDRILIAHNSNRLAGEFQAKPELKPILTLEDTLQLVATCRQISIADELLHVVRDLVRSTRPTDASCPEEIKPCIWYGAGPRAGISLVSTAKAMALIDKSETVRWKHIERLAKPVLRHRLRLTPEGVNNGYTEDSLVDRLLGQIVEKYDFIAKGIA